MKVIGHDDKSMKLVSGSSVMVNGGKHEARPAVMTKERLATRCLCGDEVAEVVAPCCLSPGTHLIPSGAKAPVVVAGSMYGLKPVPFT